MFRKMRRYAQELSREDCAAILRSEPRGVLAVHGEDGYPYALPMNYIFLDGKLYFHCALEGHRTDAVAADSRVSFCVMDKGVHRDGDWALTIRSVIVFGRLARLEDRERALTAARALGLKYYPAAQDVEALLLRSFDKMQLLELTIDHMTGKQVHEA